MMRFLFSIFTELTVQLLARCDFVLFLPCMQMSKNSLVLSLTATVLLTRFGWWAGLDSNQ